ncbi:MAG: GTPase [Lachnospiraceae bacterium]|jgi:uncharacterized membrane protein YcgQ (UPF0703/DUF1980 family)|nr:GTPase [Lachnospiraceae bacterium]
MTPVYLINGFLDSGKTTFFAYTIGQPYFRAKGTTLLILCEDGEVAYGPKLLAATNTVMEKVEKEEDLTPAAMMALDAKYKPERVLIEWNGMWNFKLLRLPHAWKMEQQITTVDASTFSMYFTNMKSLLAEQIRNTELVMFNRCDGIPQETLIRYKRNVRAINQNAELIFEDANGEIDMTTEEDLPYDLNTDPIVLEGLNYGIWYLDASEHPDRYKGKNVSFTAMVARPPKFPAGYFVPGRMAMTCCAQDMQFLGFGCRAEGADRLKEKSWVKVTAKCDLRKFEAYDGEGLVLDAKKVEPTAEPAHPIIDFSAAQ